MAVFYLWFEQNTSFSLHSSLSSTPSSSFYDSQFSLNVIYFIPIPPPLFVTIWNQSFYAVFTLYIYFFFPIPMNFMFQNVQLLLPLFIVFPLQIYFFFSLIKDLIFHNLPLSHYVHFTSAFLFLSLVGSENLRNSSINTRSVFNVITRKTTKFSRINECC